MKMEDRCTVATNKLAVPFYIKKRGSERVYGLLEKDSERKFFTPEEVGKKAELYYNNLFNGDDDEGVPDWVWRRWSRTDLQGMEEINGTMIKELIFELSSGKTCGKDLIVAEMLFQLDEDVIEEIARSFTFRLLNHASEDEDKVWELQTLNLIKKKAQAIYIEDFRPIAIIAVLHKLYSKMLLRLTGRKCDRLVAPQYAFRKHYQAHEAIFIIRQLVEKALEWDMAVFLLDGDIKKAYDYTKHSVIIKGLQSKKV